LGFLKFEFQKHEITGRSGELAAIIGIDEVRAGKRFGGGYVRSLFHQGLRPSSALDCRDQQIASIVI
jgi:hypothetical protein